MLCEKCKKRDATSFITHNKNGIEQTYGLCSECASQFYFAGLSGFAVDFSNLLGLAFSQNGNAQTVAGQTEKAVRCPECGITFKEIVNLGKVGCERCYVTFRNQLMPSIQQIHGSCEHIGKVSVNAGERMKKTSRLRDLQQQLSVAVKEQNFESAAKLRDEIKSLEQMEG